MNRFKRPAFILFSIILCVKVIFLVTKGVSLGTDSTWYINAANLCLNEGVVKYLKTYAMDNINYAVYPLFLSLIFKIGHSSKDFVVLIQIILSSLSFVLLYKILLKFVKPNYAIFSTLFVALNFEVLQWDRYLLTDPLFLSLVILFLYMYVKVCDFDKLNLLKIIGFLFIGFMLFLTRPTALVLVPISLIFLIYKWIKHTNKSNLIYLYIAGFIMSFVILTSALSRYESLVEMFTHFKEGSVIHQHYDTYIKNSDQFDTFDNMQRFKYFNALFIKRMVYFWNISLKDHSLRHTIVNYFYYVPFYFFALWGLFKAFLKRDNSNIKNRDYLEFLILWVIVVWMIHVFMVIDYDSRYRIITYPSLGVFFALGLVEFMNKFKFVTNEKNRLNEANK